MKLLFLPFIVVAAFDITLFALARIGRRITGKRTLDEVLSVERRSARRPPASTPGSGVRASHIRKRSRAAVDSHPTVVPLADRSTLTLTETAP